MRIYVWIIAAFLATTLTLSILILCYILILKLLKNRLHTSKRSIIVRPEIAKPINAFDESNARISTPSIIAVPEYPLQNTNIDELERNRASSKKSNWMSDRDPPSDESKCDYLDPLDLNFNQLHDIYIARSNHYQSKQTNWPSNNESTVITYA